MKRNGRVSLFVIVANERLSNERLADFSVGKKKEQRES